MYSWSVTVFSCTYNREFTVRVRAKESFQAWTSAKAILYGRGIYGTLIRMKVKREGR